MKKLTQEQFISLAVRIHGDKYDYSKSIYKNTASKIEIICKKHGAFLQIANNHTSKKSGCKICQNEVRNKDNIYTKKEFINMANKIHNSKYDYSRIEYNGMRNKIDIICKRHGVFSQSAKNHIHGKKGCPKCRYSKGEERIRLFLEQKNIKYEPQKAFDDCKNVNKLYFDFYLIDKNILIEYDGQQHFTPRGDWILNQQFETLKKRDKIKNDYAKKINVPLLRISYKDFSNIENILTAVI